MKVASTETIAYLEDGPVGNNVIALLTFTQNQIVRHDADDHADAQNSEERGTHLDEADWIHVSVEVTLTLMGSWRTYLYRRVINPPGLVAQRIASY